ncbi:DNA-binding response regulator, OmpR family, contains REC and winged-helix (wHTH) domain [Propionispira arboris]|uniref:DNA-binding response regulator, OmpR family, contains REC and winged-helix (WHTH) domain n=1 Tax=Propionispira arboris TaxID=84035 RepID=A0A1H6WXH1_9FIRM|nr:response regulator transcription factor [Propionispira arboris]SEJ21563.1 DNA-binding response regulator, OmpR family, contains REC and winged-helix (wHTH) domain [Propionispira arboris]
MRLLLVEDEPALQSILLARLKEEGYGTDACSDGLEAWDFLKLTEYDAVILDIMLPGMDGLTILKNLRQAKQTIPVLLLTAKDSIEDRVAGLDLGADDYLVKPFAFAELLARLRVLLRKSNAIATNLMECEALVMDMGSHTVKREEQFIVLSSKEFAILEYLLRNQGNVLSREQIESHVWDYGFDGGSNVIDVYIRYLRKKIDDPFERKLIHTVRGAGYVLREEVR